MMVYLDHNATTPPAPAVIEAMTLIMTEAYGNAASSHAMGRASAARVDVAAGQVAQLLGTSPARVVWTSGATEALNTAITAAASVHPHIVLARTEHKAVLDAVDHLAGAGVKVTFVDVDASGELSPAAVKLAAADSPFVLIAMAANNETGVVNDVRALADVTHRHGGLVVCDATQQLGKLDVDLDGWGVDFAAASAHKIYGPPGVGVLVVPAGFGSVPLIRGGGHQRGWRSGTLNVPAIVGFGVACELARAVLEREAERLTELRGLAQALLESQLGPLYVNGSESTVQLPNTFNVRIPGVPADALIVNCPDLAFSSGSACTSSVPTASHVLVAMGFSEEHAEESVRLSFGRGNDQPDVERAMKMLGEAALRIRELGS